jgi:hypothetical protein
VKRRNLAQVNYPVISRCIIGIGIVSCAVAAPAYCPEDAPYSVNKEFKTSKYVVLVVAERETWLGENGKPKPLKPPFQSGASRPWGFDPYMGALFDVRVKKSFKGSTPRHLRLFSENSTARFWLQPGRSYLLFVSPAPFDRPLGTQLTVDTCGNSGTLKGNSKLLRKLRSLAATR